jgi:hypothetical protein
MTFSVNANPALSGTCQYYIGYNPVAQATLKNGKSQATFEALFQAEVGSGKTFTVTASCRSGGRYGTGVVAVNGYR